MADQQGKIDPPFSPPDCPWVPMTSGAKVPDNAEKVDGTLDGEPLYIGRAYDSDANCYFVGSALPSKNTCIYLDRKGNLKDTAEYDILTVECSSPLEFRRMDIHSELLFVAGGDYDECLYAAKVVDSSNTYIGWVDKRTETAYIPKSSANILKDNYAVLIHKFLNRLCICPMPPGPHN